MSLLEAIIYGIIQGLGEFLQYQARHILYWRPGCLDGRIRGLPLILPYIWGHLLR